MRIKITPPITPPKIPPTLLVVEDAELVDIDVEVVELTDEMLFLPVGVGVIMFVVEDAEVVDVEVVKLVAKALIWSATTSK